MSCSKGRRYDRGHSHGRSISRNGGTGARSYFTASLWRCRMKSYLVFPNRRTATQFGYTRQRTPITWTRDHPLSSFGLGVLLDENNDLLDWYHLRLLHHRAGAHLETSDHISVRRALGLLCGEHHDLSDYIKPLYHMGLDTTSSERASKRL